MRRKILFLGSIALLYPCIAFANADIGTPELPVFPNSRVYLEVNLSDSNFLPMIKQVVTMAPLFLLSLPEVTEALEERISESNEQSTLTIQKMAKEMEKDLAIVCSGLKEVSLVWFQLPSLNHQNQLADFYMGKLGLSKGWTRTVRLENSQFVIRLYSNPNLECTFGFVANRGNVVALRTIGPLDQEALGRLATSVVKLVQAIVTDGKENQGNYQQSDKVQPDAKPTEKCE